MTLPLLSRFVPTLGESSRIGALVEGLSAFGWLDGNPTPGQEGEAPRDVDSAIARDAALVMNSNNR